LKQQPFGHVAGPHVATHWRVMPLHDGVGLPGGCVQSTHCAPPGEPHALSWLPSTHVLPTQQPVAHVTAQAAGWLTPAWQSSVPWHALHCSPPTPQKPFCVPAAQMLPTQQPAVPPTPQLAGLHVVEGVHTPPLHVSFGPHALQT
jgi:hypothetical protein